MFTGSTAVGRKVAQAAAANLTPTTLELGGKSPAIIDTDCDLREAALKIVHGKLLNAGQLQRGRRQVGGRGLRHLAPHGGGAGKHQVIKRQRGHQRRGGRVALDHAELVGRKELRHQACQLRRRVRGEFAGLEHDAVARCQSVYDRRQGQLHRVIPGGDHTHHAQRLALDPAARGQQKQRGTHPGAPAPARQVAQGVRKLGTQHEQIRHLGQARRAHAEVGLDCGRQGRAMLIDQLGQAQQALAAQRQGGIGLGAAGLALQFKNVANVVRQSGAHGGWPRRPGRPRVRQM